jgi:hypothetical protein
VSWFAYHPYGSTSGGTSEFRPLGLTRINLDRVVTVDWTEEYKVDGKPTWWKVRFKIAKDFVGHDTFDRSTYRTGRTHTDWEETGYVDAQQFAELQRLVGGRQT